MPVALVTDCLLAEMMAPATLHLDLNLIRQQEHYVLGLQRWFFINGTFLNKTGLSLFLIRKAQLKQVVIQKVLQEADPWWYFYKEMVLSLLISSCSKLSD